MRHPRTMLRICARCSAPFMAESSAVRVGKARFCSAECANQSKPRRSLATRFAEKWVPEPNSGCWLWLGAITPSTGYGAIGLGGRADGIASAHRLSYQLYRGVIPMDRQIDHLCRNRACVNPDHLEPVTRRVNWERGMHPKAVAWRQRQRETAS